MKTIVILGSTGSIGTNTLDIVDRFPEEFRVAGLTAGSNDEKLEDQIRRFKPRVVALSDVSAAARLRQRCASLPVEILAGEEGLIQVASVPEAELSSPPSSVEPVLCPRLRRSEAESKSPWPIKSRWSWQGN